MTDSGAGIDPDLLPHLFDPFVQGQRTLARSEGGLGLGLALVKGIVELHGGAVAAESAGRDCGAAFTLTLPIGPAAAARPAAEPVAPSDRRRLHVLIVDDNTDAADTLAAMLQLQGHIVDVAYDGPGALAKVRAASPDVVLCDIGLPRMSGYEVARAVRSLPHFEGRLVAVSGYAQPDDIRRCLEAGFDAHLAKPFDSERLERLLG